jgi:hypothetical protein
VKDFFQASTTFLPTVEDVEFITIQEELIDTPAEESIEPEELVDGSLDEDFSCEDEDQDEDEELPEAIILTLPSKVNSVKLGESFEILRSTERELRKGQANDALEGLRIGLANKSLLLLTNVNKSTSTKQSTRAWESVRNAQSQILHHARSYQRAWRALNSVGTPEDLAIYQKLEEKDLVVIKDITKAKRFGQGSQSLSWFWRIGPSEDELTGEWMEECEWNIIS